MRQTATAFDDPSDRPLMAEVSRWADRHSRPVAVEQVHRDRWLAYVIDGHQPPMTTGGNVAADLRRTRSTGGVSRVLAPPKTPAPCLEQLPSQLPHLVRVNVMFLGPAAPLHVPPILTERYTHLRGSRNFLRRLLSNADCGTKRRSKLTCRANPPAV